MVCLSGFVIFVVSIINIYPMKSIVPFANVTDALTSLDNGGRFYNWVSKANDGKISTSELAKAAGVFTDKERMMLFLEMSLMQLSDDEKQQIWERLSTDLVQSFQKHAPQQMLPSEARLHAKPSSMVVVKGVTRWVESKDQFSGFIMVPIMIDKVTSFTMIPIVEQYDLYELRDHESDEYFLIAQAKGSERLPDQTMQFGGVIRELRSRQDKKSERGVFLEAIYYAPVSQVGE